MIKKGYSQLSEKAIKTPLFPNYMYVWGLVFFLSFKQNDISQQTEWKSDMKANMKI